MHYSLTCLHCHKKYDEAQRGFLLSCDQEHRPAFLRAQYAETRLAPQQNNPGIFRYNHWLPVNKVLEGAQGPVVYQSQKLAAELRLQNLYIIFNGYWPEKGAFLEACSFKELESLSVCARIPGSEDRTMVVSSAGNTGMAFMQTCSTHGIPLLVLVPERALAHMWMSTEKHPQVLLAVLRGNSDYADTIRLANLVSELDEYYPEGGAKNIARRDGMGSVVLAAVEEIGAIPAHYFQAVGSGTGGIAAWEASRRLVEDGRFGKQKMKLHLVQNEPFCIMTRAWKEASPLLPELSESEAKDRINHLHAPVLSNRRPPYSIKGGVFDALTDSGGTMYSVSNEAAGRAGYLFEKLEGCDLAPAAEVAVAGLMRAIELKNIDEEDIIALNITGGGRKILEKAGKIRLLKPDIILTPDSITEKDICKSLSRITA